MLTDPKKQILTLRQRIILSHVWSLAPEEVMCLDRYTKQYIQADRLYEALDTAHAYKDYVISRGQSYEIHYVNACTDLVGLTPKKENFLISFRANLQNNFYCALILKNPKPNQLTDNTPQYLVGEGVQ